jgi:hypothetical protein
MISLRTEMEALRIILALVCSFTASQVQAAPPTVGSVFRDCRARLVAAPFQPRLAANAVLLAIFCALLAAEFVPPWPTLPAASSRGDIPL